MKLSAAQVAGLRAIEAGEVSTNRHFIAIFGINAGTYSALETRELVEVAWTEPLPGRRPGFERFPVRLTPAGREALKACQVKHSSTDG